MNCSEFFSFNNVRTRGHNFKLYLPECRLIDTRKFSFSHGTIVNLPFDVFNAVSLSLELIQA